MEDIGTRNDVLYSFSLLPPVVRYKVLIFLYSKYPHNIYIIDKLALAIVKSFNAKEAIKWVEEEKDNLLNWDTMSEEVFTEIVGNKGIEKAEFLRFNDLSNMYG